MDKIGKYTRVTGTDRDALRTEVVEMYEIEQLSVREIAAQIGRSYGAVHGLLKEAKVKMRKRGNPKTRD